MGQVEALLRVDVADDADSEEAARLTGQLRAELLELDVDDVVPPSGGPAPDGSRAVDVAMIGALLVRFGPGLAAPVVRVIQSWLQRSGARSVELELNGQKIKVTGASSTAEQQLVDAWIASATAGPARD